MGCGGGGPAGAAVQCRSGNQYRAYQCRSIPVPEPEKEERAKDTMTCTLPSFLNSPDPVIWSGNVVVTLVQPRKNRDTTRKTGISPFCKKQGCTCSAGCVPGWHAGEQDHTFHKSYYPTLPSIRYRHAGSRHTGTSALPFREYGAACPGSRDGERLGIPSRQN